MVLIENYRHAKSPLNSSSIVSLCEEDAIVFNEATKKEVKFKKLYLLCNSTGTRFSNQEISEENEKRIREVLSKSKKSKKNGK
jgi:hypothetical protein